jgi:hypothetical protein
VDVSTLEEQIANTMAGNIRKQIDRNVLIEAFSHWPDSLYADDSQPPGPNLPEGWAGEWSTHTTHVHGWELWASMVRWIRDSIHNPEKNAYWNWDNGRIQVYIRRPQDLTAFLLRWS